jgi:hypothetical protein
MADELRTGITRIESDGSFWMIDNDLRRYCRFPKNEMPRENPDWGSAEAGLLQDAVWHDFAGDWRIEPTGRLFIETEFHDGKGWFGPSAPSAVVV